MTHNLCLAREQKQLAALSAKIRPAQVILGTTDLAEFVWGTRRHLKIKQAQLAERAKVGRQWLVAMEQGKPSLSFGHVMRVVEALGYEMELKPVEPIPPWILTAMRGYIAGRAEQEHNARMRRRSITRRRVARADRLNENAEKRVMLDLD